MSFKPDRTPTSLRGKQVLVTGATAGIGRAAALAFASEGCRVVALGRRKDRLDTLVSEAGSLHGDIAGYALDVRDDAATRRLGEDDPDVYAKTDILVNNAGLARGRDLVHEAKIEDLQEMLDTNVMGLLRMTRLIVPHMVERGAGHIVNLGSVAGRWVYKGGAVYSATKHAVLAISEGLRYDLHGSGVRVSNIEPGLVETEFSVVRMGDQKAADKVYEGTTPLVPEDIAEIIVWCCQRPGHVNIQEIIVYPTDQAAVMTVHRRPEA